ncbi:hypothetical protein [Jiangella rhizosphaerae]|uniref:Uncharacterized protein n=1 Tax=Jiangella rhizosphaerae TaxID=2293569 RepID=A0A418KLU8_9ACTN|nr:hypothetical protein [Jiangella rhizosphaerae]RIQ18917.1 hypothetical protein DY240_20360 [Jiangella rhizosphaerae]
MAPTPPTDAELDVMIRARLAAVGIDLDQLPPGTAADPETGAPGQAAVLASLRSFARSSLAEISAWVPPAPAGTPAAQAVELSQQAAPMLYPSISSAWREA